MSIGSIIPPLLNSALRFRIAATHQIRPSTDSKTFQFSTGSAAPLINDQAAYLALTKKKVDPLTTSEEKGLFDKPQGIVEETLNALDLKQQKIQELTKKLDTAKSQDQKDAIQDEIKGEAAELNRIQSSENYTKALGVLDEFRTKLATAQTAEDRKAAKDFLLTHSALLGDRITKFLTAASDEDAKTFISRLKNIAGTKFSVNKDERAGPNSPTKEFFNDEQEQATLNLNAPTQHVLNLKLDTATDRKISLAFLNGFSGALEKIADQVVYGKIEDLFPIARVSQPQEPVKDPHVAMDLVTQLKKSIEGNTLLGLLNAGDDIDRFRAKQLLGDF